MIGALTWLLVFQLTGEVIARGLNLPVPGPVIGMGLLFLTLLIKGGPGEDLKQTSGTLLQNLSLLFVPAGTGVMLHLHRLQEEWLAIVAALLISTFAGMAVTALVLKTMLPRRPKTSEGAPHA